MRRTRFEDWNCSIARATDILGDWWTPLVLREAFYGTRRFDDFVENLGIGRNILTERLKRLTGFEVIGVPGNPAPAFRTKTVDSTVKVPSLSANAVTMSASSISLKSLISFIRSDSGTLVILSTLAGI